MLKGLRNMFPKSSALQEHDLPDKIVISQMFEITHDAMTRIKGPSRWLLKIL